MFSGNRRFSGRQGEQIYNQELYTLYEILKHFLDTPDNPDPNVGPQSGLEKPGALWLDRQNNPGYAHVMYKDRDNTWKPIFDDWFKIIKDIRNDNEPNEPQEGQLWIDEHGILNWYNGSIFVPIKSQIADSVDFNTNTFENFLLLDSLKMTGGHLIDNLQNMAKLANGIIEWKPRTLYKLGQIVYYTDSNGETLFYEFTDKIVDWSTDMHLSATTFQGDLDRQYLVKTDLKAQFLIPSEMLDKLFIDGHYANKDTYDRISDVCIQLSMSLYEGKTIAAVHVNPVALRNIQKRIAKIEKNQSNTADYGIIRIGPDNTEYYGFVNGFGQLLHKGEHYYVNNGAICLTEKAIDIFDFVYCITYEFDTNIKTKGILYKDTVSLSKQASISIGPVDSSDKLMVFSEGFCLADIYYTHNCNDQSGIIEFKGYDKNRNIVANSDEIVTSIIEDNSSVAIMKFQKRTNLSAITSDMIEEAIKQSNEDNNTRYIASIPYDNSFKRPLVFVQNTKSKMALAEFKVQNNKLVVQDVQPGAAYYIVDAVKNDYDTFVDSNTVNSTCKIPISDTELLTEECQPILFIDGLYVSTKDIDMSEPGFLTVNGLSKGQRYLLLKDKLDSNSQLLFDGTIKSTIITLEHEIDDAVVFIENTAVIDGGACTTTSTSTEDAYHNEVRLIINEAKEKWHCFNKVTSEWEEIIDKDFIDLLNMSISGYSITDKTISILQDFKDVDCTYYAYRFADNIEKPLIKGYTDTWEEIDNEIFYRLDSEHSYPFGQNTLSVWINGVKQNIKEHYIIESVNNVSKDFQKTVYGFKIAKPTDEKGNELSEKPTAFYIIELPENREYKSCITEYISDPVNTGTYVTKSALLTPGIPRVFVDGYRQPMESYVISNINTLTLLEPLVTKENNKVIIIDENGNMKPIEVESRSSILIEVRQDYTLKEKTITLSEEVMPYVLQGGTAVFNSSMIFANNQSLPIDLFAAKISEICVYINGAAYGMNVSKMQIDNVLMLNNVEANKLITVGDRITFEWR